ncbi:MAG: hypothetical protein ABJY83_06140 [Roseibium sp.]
MDAGQQLALQTQITDPVVSAPLVVAIERAIEIVRDETDALRANPTTDLKSFEYRKSQALLDLTRARTMVPPASYSPELKECLTEFKFELDENMKLLRLHKDAVSEVVETMSRIMIDLDSDGTYEAPFPERAK